MKRRVHVWIDGRVQGVFFRAYMRDAAIKEGVKGWVQNLPDGKVEAVMEGDAEAINKMIAWCHKGSPLSRVDDVIVKEELFQDEFSDFIIRR
ncbi:MAG: acylphosphatase [Syntrophobacterales bacterium]|nr:acylphosphatase [Syntrophobacterales bacterium]